MESTSVACWLMGMPVLRELAREAAPLREVFGFRGRLDGDHVVADRLIEMLAVGVDVDVSVALEHRVLDLRRGAGAPRRPAAGVREGIDVVQ